MRYLIYVLAFIPYAIGGPIGAQQGVLSFACRAASGGLMKIPIGDTRTSVTSSCSVVRSRVKKITDYPKAFTPGFNQKMLVTSKTRKFYISPLNTAKYPNTFAITTDECELAAVMMAGPRGLPSSQSATPPGAVNRPANSVRTRPGSPVAQSVRTVRPFVSRSESSAGKLEKRVVKGSDLTLCRPSTYDWDADVSGTGRQVGNIPVSGRRASF